MTAPLPTPGEVEGMQDRHVAIPGSDIGGPLLCERCMFAWPCDAARLLALVDSLRVRMQHLENVFAQQDDRLAAVLAECDRADEACDWGHIASPYGDGTLGGPITLVHRIRRAATGEAT